MSLKLMIVRAAYLPEAPVAFRQYVEEYFIPKTLFGQDVRVAVQYVTEPRFGYGLGKAPRHTLDLQRFNQGLPEGLGLSGWMNRQLGKNIFEHFIEVDDTPGIRC